MNIYLHCTRSPLLVTSLHMQGEILSRKVGHIPTQGKETRAYSGIACILPPYVRVSGNSGYCVGCVMWNELYLSFMDKQNGVNGCACSNEYDVRVG